MASARLYSLSLIALLALCFGLGAWLQPRYRMIERQNHQSDNFFSLVFGSSSRIFANDFYYKADAYYHSGYYPSIFDNHANFQTPHMAADTGAVASHNQGEENTGFMGPPRNWVDAFGRHFIPNRHSHLDEGGAAEDLSNSQEVREILPWLKFSAELDPDNVNTYVVTAFWLRTKMNNNKEAEEVLRDGLRHSPKNPQLLFELARVYLESYGDTVRSRNMLTAAADLVRPRVTGKPADQVDFDDRFMYEQLETKLAELEEYAGNVPAAVDHLQHVKAVSPNPDAIQKHINQLQEKAAGHPAPAGANSPAH